MDLVLKGWGEKGKLSGVCRNNSGEEERGKKRELKEAENWQIRRTGTNKSGAQAQTNQAKTNQTNQANIQKQGEHQMAICVVPC